jgi:lipopolysaccharide export system protein LptC
MKRPASHLILLAALLALSACKSGPAVRITNDKPEAKPVAQSRSEPIFYNGKTYHLDFSPAGGGAYDMAVSGMNPKQKNDAVAVATSSLGYFACPDGQRGKLQNSPAYAGAKWRMQAKCG